MLQYYTLMMQHVINCSIQMAEGGNVAVLQERGKVNWDHFILQTFTDCRLFWGYLTCSYNGPRVTLTQSYLRDQYISRWEMWLEIGFLCLLV